MPGLGTIVNVIAIAAAGIIGCLAGERIAPRFQDTLMKATAIAVLFLGLGGTMAQMLTFKHGSFSTQGTMMLIGSLASGCGLRIALPILANGSRKRPAMPMIKNLSKRS